MSFGKRIAVGVIAAAVIGTGGFFVYRKISSEAAAASGKVYVQRVSEINTASAEFYAGNAYSGIVEPQKSVDVKFDAEKVIDEILVSDGDSVKKGDKLFTYNIEAIQLQLEQAKLDAERMQNEVNAGKAEIADLEKAKASASAADAVTYSTQIISLQSDVAKTEYDIKAKNVEIQKIETSLGSAYVTAPIDGTVRNITTAEEAAVSEKPDVLMQVVANGDFRIKGTFNEQNSADIYQGEAVIIKSRIDDKVWHGTVSEIDTNPQQNNNDMYGYYSVDESMVSSKYAFYVQPDSLDGLMLGQHLLIEPDYGFDEASEKEGIWLYSDFICEDDGKSFVWVKNDKDKIEKRYVETGDTDLEYGDCCIISGLSESDYIAYPSGDIKSGMKITTNQSDISVPDNDLGGVDDEMMMDDMGGYEEDFGGMDGEYYDDEYYPEDEMAVPEEEIPAE